MRLSELLKDVTGIIEMRQDLAEDREISLVTADSRQVKPGALFICCPGENSDGHRFIGQALERGAAAALIQDGAWRRDEVPWILVRDSRQAMGQIFQNYRGRPSLAMGMIGITGTNGKTTVAHMIAAILEANQQKVGLLGTVENRVGKRRLPQKLTTPDSPELAELLREIADAGADYTVMEVSSHALAQGRVAGVEFDLAVFTNLSQDHLDYHGTMAEYRHQKAKLFSGLSPQGEKKRRKAAILNLDDPSCLYLADHCRVPVITYGLDPLCHLRAENLELGPGGSRFNLVYGEGRYPVKLRLHGRFNVYNALAAAAAALVEGVPFPVIQAALAALEPVPGRFQPVVSRPELPFHVYVDYAHTPDGLEKCLTTARELCTGRVITVFGAGGHRDRAKRPLMGQAAARLSDICIVTSDNPRDEEPGAIMADILTGMSGPGQRARVWQEPDRRRAIGQAIGMARPGDIVMICGKGHENYQLIGDKALPFSDYAEALQFMAASSRP